MNKEIQNQSNLAIVNNGNEIKQFQSIYYLLKGKRDTDIKLFDDNKKFSYSDILELNEKINKKLDLHQKVTNIVNITVGLDNKEIKSFGNWNEFVNTDWNISAKTKYITLEWDFNIILPNQQHNIPQTHTLRIRIGNNLKPSEMIQVVFEGSEEYDLEEVESEMVCKIDFVNSQICNELKSVVSDWYDSLRKNNEENNLVSLVRKYKETIRMLIIFFFLTAGVILCNYLFSFLSGGNFKFTISDSGQKLFFFITWSIPLIFIFYGFGKFYAERILRKTIHKFRRNPMFELTKGDKNKLRETIDLNNKLLKKLAVETLCSMGVNFVTYTVGIVLNNYK